MSCGVIFWGYSVYTKKVLYIQEKTSTIMSGTKKESLLQGVNEEV